MMALSKKTFFTVLALAVVAIVILVDIFLVDDNINDEKSVITNPRSFIDCLNAGGDIEFSEPMTCATESGEIFTQEIKKISGPQLVDETETVAAVEAVVPAEDCVKYNPEKCPASCVVCPPSLTRSSLSCQSEEYCANLGIDRTWYEEIKASRLEIASSSKAHNKPANDSIVETNATSTEEEGPAAEETIAE